ncbi:hypothetical protein CANARDRAFT_22988 [[Candida] arabinofermentans NRRL YB-2248]|uniref:ATP synthase subunit H, mitochondrial n=1 Tax=[Candida] arabinofermentans NRRL YB-2248 TaxID=983967 RepID=A0A1E4T124_9ASCO|nr:hypothetical protein CANARDRAFT_22988 [[Candida] arabinofermentans NRRL YB-2248]
MFTSAIYRASVSKRCFSISVPRANLISDLYVKELKAFKPTPISAASAESATKPWKAPVAAKIPALEAEGADALAEYDSAPVEVLDASADGSVVAEYKPDDWFVFEEEEEVAHH